LARRICGEVEWRQLSKAGNWCSGFGDGRSSPTKRDVGRELWKPRSATGVVARPDATYYVDGVQYVSIAVGGRSVRRSSSAWPSSEGPRRYKSFEVAARRRCPSSPSTSSATCSRSEIRSHAVATAPRFTSRLAPLSTGVAGGRERRQRQESRLSRPKPSATCRNSLKGPSSVIAECGFHRQAEPKGCWKIQAYQGQSRTRSDEVGIDELTSPRLRSSGERERKEKAAARLYIEEASSKDMAASYSTAAVLIYFLLFVFFSLLTWVMGLARVIGLWKLGRRRCEDIEDCRQDSASSEHLLAGQVLTAL